MRYIDKVEQTISAAIRAEIEGRTDLETAIDAFQAAVQESHIEPQAFNRENIQQEIVRRLVADIAYAASGMEPELLIDELRADPDGYYDKAAVATAEHLARLTTDGAVIRKPQRLFDRG